jgi:acyl-CoA thioester hydrolase
MLTHEVQIRVSYADTDQMGYVYYGTYARYFEIARVEMLRSIGFSYKEMEASGIMMPVLEHYTKYLYPARYDDLLTVKTYVKKAPGVRMNFEYEIFNEDQQLLTTGNTMLVFITQKNRKPCPPPATLADRLQPFFAGT